MYGRKKQNNIGDRFICVGIGGTVPLGKTHSRFNLIQKRKNILLAQYYKGFPLSGINLPFVDLLALWVTKDFKPGKFLFYLKGFNAYHFCFDGFYVESSAPCGGESI